MQNSYHNRIPPARLLAPLAHSASHLWHGILCANHNHPFPRRRLAAGGGESFWEYDDLFQLAKRIITLRLPIGTSAKVKLHTTLVSRSRSSKMVLNPAISFTDTCLSSI